MKSRPILVTGAAGFIGARIVEHFNQQKHPLVSVDISDTFARPEHRSLNFGTKVDREELFDFLKTAKSGFDAVIHMGASSSTTVTDEAYLQKWNVEYSQHLWNYCSEMQIPFFYASSAATYGDGELGYEDDESKMRNLKPLNPYGRSKLRFDLWALEQEKSKKHPPAWAGFKFFNVYGFGEEHKTNQWSVVYKAFFELKKEGVVKLFKSHKKGIADGDQKRDFVYVGDIVNILDFAMKHPIRRGIYNCGTGKARSFLDLAKAVFAALDQKEKIEFVEMPEILRDKYQYFTEAPMTKIRKAGYNEPPTHLEAGVRDTIKQLIKHHGRP